MSDKNTLELKNLLIEEIKTNPIDNAPNINIGTLDKKFWCSSVNT